MVRRLLVSTCVLLMVAAGIGQAATTGRMTGTVQDSGGIALPGVTVSISSDKLIGGSQMSITGANGDYVFNLLPIGMYTVEANLPGFQPAVAEIRVSLERVSNVVFNMVDESFGGEVTVVATVPVVDVAQVNSQVVFDQDYLQQAAIGSGGRDYLQIISQAAGVAGSGNASVYGGTAGDNSYLVDGLNTSDPLLGTFGTNFNYDAIQEISFQTGGFEAEFGQATGGIINLVTKSGGNEFSGTLDMRYRDDNFIESGDHYDKDEQTSSLRNISATLGGPILRDKLWFFLSLENAYTQNQATGAPVIREYDGWNYIAKATWQLNDSHRMVIKYSGDPADIPGVNSSAFMVAEASRTQKQGGDIYQVELNSVLSETLLLNAQIGASYGYIESGPTYQSDLQGAHDNEDNDILYNNTYATSADDRDREEFRVNLSYFVDDLAGAHEFKAGLEYNDLYYGSSGYYNGGGVFTDVTGGATYQDINGDGFFNHYVDIKEIEGNSAGSGYDFDEIRSEYLETSGNIKTFFLQDAWRPISNLTVKPGIRVDNVVMDNHTGENVADMTKWQPRIGIAWDIKGDAKHVIRGSWGRFMDPTALSIPNFAIGVPQIYHEYNTLEFYCNSLGLCDADRLPSSWDNFEWTNPEGYVYTLIDNRATTVNEPAQTVDQMCRARNADGDPSTDCNYSLSSPYADELVLAYETQIAPETSLEFSYINKKTKDIIEDSCSGNTWINGETELPSLDDPSTWTTTGDGCAFWMIGNMPTFHRDYEAAIVKFETRKESFHILASYTYSESKGNTANGSRQSYATGLGDYYPVHFYNRQGWMPDQRDNRVKLSGYWLLPRDWTVGFDGFYSSAGRLTVTSTCTNFRGASDEYIIENGGDPDAVAYCSTGDGAFLGSTDIFWTERGAVETKSTWQVDAQVSKAFHVAKMDITAIFAIYNIAGTEFDRTFNSTAMRQRTDDNGDPLVDDSGDPVYWGIGDPTSYQQPRRYEIGLRIEF